MNQQTFSDFEYSNRKRKTKREELLEIMDEIIPWGEWVGIIMPFTPVENAAVRPRGLNSCCGCICYGSICPTRGRRTQPMTPFPRWTTAGAGATTSTCRT